MIYEFASPLLVFSSSFRRFGQHNKGNKRIYFISVKQADAEFYAERSQLATVTKNRMIRKEFIDLFLAEFAICHTFIANA